MEIRYYGDKISERIAKTPEGFLICQDVPISRTGYQEYLASELMENPTNGHKIIPVYRPAKEVFDIRSLASFEGKPVTNEHPDEDVTPENYQRYSCGHVQNVHVGEGEDANKVLADLYITDPGLIRLIEDGKREISCGYYAEEKKDETGRLCQTHIRGNHVAVVRNGRAGKHVCIRDRRPRLLDEGKKGMKKGQHVKAHDPEYLAKLKAAGILGAAVGAGAGIKGYKTAKKLKEEFNASNEMRKALGMSKGQYARGLVKSAGSEFGGKLKGLAKSSVGKFGKAAVLGGIARGALGLAGEQALSSMIQRRTNKDSLYGNYSPFNKRKTNGGLSSMYYNDYLPRRGRRYLVDEDILEDEDELLEDEDEILEDEDYLEDEEEILEDDDEILEDEDEVLEDDEDVIVDDDEDEFVEDDDEYLEDDEDYIEDEDEEYIEDEDELVEDGDFMLHDAGVKGMKKGQHIKAKDPDYLARLKGGAAAVGAGAAAAGAYKTGQSLRTAHALRKATGMSLKEYAKETGKAAAKGARNAAVKGVSGGIMAGRAAKAAGRAAAKGARKAAVKGVASGIMAGRAAKAAGRAVASGARKAAVKGVSGGIMAGRGAKAAGKAIGGAIRRNPRAALAAGIGAAAMGGINALRNRKKSHDSLYWDRYKLPYYDEDTILEDDELILEDEDELLEDEDEILEDEDEILEDEDELVEDDEDLDESAKSVIQDAKSVLRDAKRYMRRLQLRDAIILNDDDLEEEESEPLTDEDLLEDEDYLEDEDELLEDEDEFVEDEDEEPIEDDEDVVVEDDDEFIEDGCHGDEDVEVLEDDEDELVNTTDEDEAIDTDKTKALREITEASRGITDPNERKQLQDAIYKALCGKNQMADVMRITKKNRSRMDAAPSQNNKVDLNQQQSIYDSFNPHKKTSF